MLSISSQCISISMVTTSRSFTSKPAVTFELKSPAKCFSCLLINWTS